MPHVEILNHRIFYTWSTAPDGAHTRAITVLLIHGLGSSHAFFEPIIPDLVSKGYACLALDLPGSAQSPFSGADSETGLTGISAIVKELVHSHTPVDNAIVAVGHSMGALVVSELASIERLAKVVFLGPVYPSLLVSRVFEERIRTVTEVGMESLANMIPSAATGSAATSLQRSFIRALLLSQTPDGYASLCRVIAGASADVYRNLQCPVLIIAGEDDQTADMVGLRKIIETASEAASIVIKTLPGVGHWHCIEAPEAVARSILSFVHDIDSSEMDK